MQVQKQEIRDRIINSAARLFIRNGYAGTSLKMIAEKCYISKSNFYRYFRSKEELYELLVSPARNSIMSMMQYYLGGDFTGKYSDKKIMEISAGITPVIYRYRQGMLIMLRAGEGRDYELIKTMVTKMFVAECPVENYDFKVRIVELLMTALSDIVMRYEDEEDIREQITLLFLYHYKGLIGVRKDGK